MTAKKESNSFKCYLANPDNCPKVVTLKSQHQKERITKKILISDIEELQKSLNDLQIEKEDLTLRLLQQFKDVKRSKRSLERGIHKGLEEMMFTISHRVRLPLTNILGLANLLTNISNTNEENLEFIELIKKSANDLDSITKELSAFIYELDHKKGNQDLKIK